METEISFDAGFDAGFAAGAGIDIGEGFNAGFAADLGGFEAEAPSASLLAEPAPLETGSMLPDVMPGMAEVDPYLVDAINQIGASVLGETAALEPVPAETPAAAGPATVSPEAYESTSLFGDPGEITDSPDLFTPPEEPVVFDAVKRAETVLGAYESSEEDLLNASGGELEIYHYDSGEEEAVDGEVVFSSLLSRKGIPLEAAHSFVTYEELDGEPVTGTLTYVQTPAGETLVHHSRTMGEAKSSEIVAASSLDTYMESHKFSAIPPKVALVVTEQEPVKYALTWEEENGRRHMPTEMEFALRDEFRRPWKPDSFSSDPVILRDVTATEKDGSHDGNVDEVIAGARKAVDEVYNPVYKPAVKLRSAL